MAARISPYLAFLALFAIAGALATGCGSAPADRTGTTNAGDATGAPTEQTGEAATTSEAGVRCGDATCAGTDVCCGGGIDACAPSPDACFSHDAAGSMQGSAVTCDGREDCAGAEVCCVVEDPMAGSSAECMPSSHCAAYGGEVACHRDVECASGETCAPVDVGAKTFPAALRGCN